MQCAKLPDATTVGAASGSGNEASASGSTTAATNAAVSAETQNKPGSANQASVASGPGVQSATTIATDSKATELIQVNRAATGNSGSKKLSMKLSGSLCMGCLMEFEKRLRAFPGVSRVKLDIPSSSPFSYTGSASGNGPIVSNIVYDSGQVAKEDILNFIRSQNYQPYKVVEK